MDTTQRNETAPSLRQQTEGQMENHLTTRDYSTSGDTAQNVQDGSPIGNLPDSFLTGSNISDRDLTEATNVSIAARMAKDFKDRLCYVRSTDKVSAIDRAAGWLQYRHGVWTRDGADNYALDAVEQTIRAMLKEVAETERDSSRLQERQRNLLNALNRTPTIRVVAAAKMARSLRDFDANANLLNCQNGTLELGNADKRKITFRPHDAKDLCTMQVQANYRPNQKAPRWEQFLGEVFAGDQEVIAYVKRALGYSLLGSNPEHVLFVSIGSGGNGKSTLLGLVVDVLGGYGGLLSPDVLVSDLVRTGTSLLPELTALRSTRLILSSEPRKGVLNSARMKSWTGESHIQVRMMYGEPENMAVTFTIWLMTNVLPDLNEHTTAIDRRIRVIPFNVSFVGRENIDLKATLWEERDGILTSLVEGLQDWREKGLDPPEELVRAAKDWYESDNVFQMLFNEALVRDPMGRVLLSDFREVVSDFIEEHSEDIPSYTIPDAKFLNTLTKHFGLFKRTVGGQVYIYGVRLRTEVAETEHVSPSGRTIDQIIWFTLNEAGDQLTGKELAEETGLNQGSIYVILKRM